MDHPPEVKPVIVWFWSDVQASAPECLSQWICSGGGLTCRVQILRNQGSMDTFVRLTKNSNSYDLTKSKTVSVDACCQEQESLSTAEKVLIRGEITSIMKMLRDAMP